MADSIQVRCSNCGTVLPNPPPAACPSCGATSKTYVKQLTATATPRAELSWVHERREILNKHRWLRPTLLTFNLASLVGGFFLAQWLGFAIGLGLVVAGELFVPKVVERITRTPGKA